MTIGMEKEMYPYHLADMKIWAPGTRIVNCSLPGFTSADACAFFFRNKKNLEPLAAVVIYIGHCDAISSELRKGKYSLFRQWVDGIRSKKVKTRLKNRLYHFEWNNDFDGAIEAPEDPEDYHYNISRIVRALEHRHIPVILIRPQAHVLFPAGIGKGNFVYYKYCGIYDRIADRISIEDVRFKEALRLQENREFSKAMTVYKDILSIPGPNSANLEFQTIVVNNYAVCAAETNAIDEAEYLLNLLLKERGVRKEIILYNLAQISRLRNNEEEYLYRLTQSYEADQSMYRIREPYQLAIDSIASQFKNVSVINLKEFIADGNYVDHCHPLPESQKLIARQIVEKLQIPELQGNQPLKIENWLYNPEYALGNSVEFHSYFKTFASFSPDEIENFISRVKIASQTNEKLADNWEGTGEDVPETIQIALKYHLKHPCFPGIQDIIVAGPFLPSDVGRFPEYFLFRYLIPYLKVAEKSQELSELFSKKIHLLRTSEEFLSILPNSAKESIEKNKFIFNLDYEQTRLPAILQKVNKKLIEHLQQGNQIYNRLKTTIYWYFRETLRFGSHSRISMRYERIPLEFMAEALAVAAVLDFHMGSKMRFEIQRLIEWLEETVQTHEYFCRQFSLEHNCGDLLNQYDFKLMDIARRMEASISHRASQEMESGKCLS